MQKLKKPVSILLAVIMVVSLFTVIPTPASAAEAVEYVYLWWDADAKEVKQETRTCSDYTEMSERSSDELESGWYAASGNLFIDSRLFVRNGETVNLILKDGATLNVHRGIGVESGATLNIYGQSQGTGTFEVVFDPGDDRNYDNAMIGGTGENGSSGTISIHGGVLRLDSEGPRGAGIGGGSKGSPYIISIYGGDISVSAFGAGAGIGGGYEASASSYNGEGIRIYGGTIEAESYTGAGIGNGYCEDSSYGSVAIYGGSVNARSLGGGSGIGGGMMGANGKIYIYGGDVNATAEDDDGQAGAGIGSGANRQLLNWENDRDINISGGAVTAISQTGAGIGAGYQRKGGKVNITGGAVFACSTGGGAGIGGGYEKKGGEINIKDAVVMAYSTGEVDRNVFETVSSNMVSAAQNALHTVLESFDGSILSAFSGLGALFNASSGKGYGAGIGGGDKGKSGTINIKDSVVIARGGDQGPGIGCGKQSKYGNITIEGSYVDAFGGEYGAGIGGGNEAGPDDNTKISIIDSTVKATGGTDCAGIGTGNESGNAGEIIITGSDVESHGGDYAAGIGGGDDVGGGNITIRESTVKAWGGKDGAGIGGGEDGGGGTVEIYGSEVYAEGKHYGAGIGCGEDGEDATIRIDNDCVVEAVAGSEGWSAAIGHGDYPWGFSYGTIHTALGSKLVVEDENGSIYTGDERFQAVWNHKRVKIHQCDHTSSKWIAVDAMSHSRVCNVCGESFEVGTHEWDANYKCTLCGASATTGTMTVVERDNSGEVRTETSIPLYSLLALPECTVAPDGMEFIYWKLSTDESQYYEEGDPEVFSGDVTVTAVYLPVVETNYIDENGSEQTVNARRLSADVLNTSIMLPAGWYVVDSDITSENTVYLYRGVNLIMADGKTWELNVPLPAIDVRPGFSSIQCSLNLYGQSAQTGTLQFSDRGLKVGNFRQYGGVVDSKYDSYNATETIMNGRYQSDHVSQNRQGYLIGGNIEIDTYSANGQLTLGWTHLTDSIRINNLSVTSTSYYATSKVSVEDGKALQDEDGYVYSGTLSDSEINWMQGETLRPYLGAHHYGEPAWTWSSNYHHATATFTCTDEDCGDVQEVEADVTVSEDGDDTVYTAVCTFNAQEYTDVKRVKTVFSIIVENSENGAVNADKTKAKINDTVGLSFTPAQGYAAASVSVVDSQGEAIIPDENAFKMPASDVTVSAEFIPVVPRVEPYIDENGAYILGSIEHIEIDGANYAVNADGSIGGELGDLSLSYFEFKDNGSAWQINRYTGPTDDMSVLEIPKTYENKPITILGNNSNTQLIDYTDKTKGQYELKLTENIEEIRPYTFYTDWVAAVTGDTSNLKTLGDYAFSWVNSPGGFTLDITLDYAGRISTGYGTFNHMNVIAHLKHATELSTANTWQTSLIYDFTDAHIYGAPSWKWSDDHSSATATFTCTDARCKHQESVNAVVTREVRDGKNVRVATVSFNGVTYTDVKDASYFGRHSLSLNGDIGVNFYLSLTDQEITDGATVDFVWTVNGVDKTHSVTLTAADKTSCGYKASCPIAVAEMTYDITATLTIGETAAATDTYAAVTYANVILNDGTFRTNYIDKKGETKYNQLVTLVQTMLDYGSKAQVRFDRNTEHLANGGNDYFTSEVNIPAGAVDMDEYLGDCGLEYVGTSVVYLSETTLRHYYRIVDPSKFTEEIKKGITFDGEAVTCGVKNGMIYFDKKDIAASQLDTEYVICINGHEYPYSALDYSALSYGSDDKPYSDSITKQLAAAVYRYNQAANAYFAD